MEVERLPEKGEGSESRGGSSSQGKSKREETLKRIKELLIMIRAPFPERLIKKRLKEDAIDEVEREPASMCEIFSKQGLGDEENSQGYLEKDPLPLEEKPQRIELKTLPPELKYVYLGEGKKQPQPPRVSPEITISGVSFLTSMLLREPERYLFSLLRYKHSDTWAARPLPILLLGGKGMKEALHLQQGQNVPEPEPTKPAFISYTRYSRKQTRASRFVAKEGAIPEPEGDSVQGSTQEIPPQTLESLDSGKVYHRTRNRRVLISSDDEDVVQERSTEDVRLQDKGSEVEPMRELEHIAEDVEMPQAYFDFEQDSSDHFKPSVEDDEDSADEFSVNRSLGTDIMNPVLRMVQIYLGVNLLGQ